MRKNSGVMALSVSLLLALALMGSVPASAGLPDGIIVEVTQSGAPKASCLAHGLYHAYDNWTTETFADATRNSYTDANNQNWVAMYGPVGDNAPYTVGAGYVYAGSLNYDFIVWSGLSTTSLYAQITATAWNPTGDKTCVVTYQNDAGDYLDHTLRHGESVNFSVYAPKLALDQWDSGTHVWASVTPVPEPGSMLALASGMIALVGFARRRRS